MSVVFVVAPAVVVGWPILCASVAGVAGALGYKVLTGTECCNAVEEDSSVEVSIEGSEVVADSMKRESQFVITNGDIRATFKRSADGRCSVHVSGHAKTEEELNAIGQEILGRVTQQYAYNKVVSELKQQGFTVTNEEMTEDHAVRIRVRKYT